jgi:hypothetical protein
VVRILQKIARSNSRLGPVYLSKIDIVDGFYRIAIRPEDVPKLAIVFPTEEGEEQWVGFPFVLPMGWKQSPPFFTSATETVADMSNSKLHSKQPSSPHRIDMVSETAIQPEVAVPGMAVGPKSLPLPARSSPSLHRKPLPVKSWEVYVEDCVGMVQGNMAHQQHVKRILISSLDEVLRKIDDQGNVHRKEPASIKKMLKGDTTWATRKVVLGWLLDTVAMNVQLPSHQVTHLFEILDSIAPKQRRTTVNKWHKLLGELQSMVLAIPGGRGLFSILQDALRTKGEQGT